MALPTPQEKNSFKTPPKEWIDHRLATLRETLNKDTVSSAVALRVRIGITGGGGRIRTSEGLTTPPVFKTGALNHYATPPFARFLMSNKPNGVV